MPGRPAELTVGRGLQAHVFLHPDGLGDRVVLDGPQVLGGQLPGRELLARAEQALGAQQAPDVIGTERRCSSAHETFLALGGPSIPAGSITPGSAARCQRARARAATRTVAAMSTTNRARPPRMKALPVMSCRPCQWYSTNQGWSPSL